MGDLFGKHQHVWAVAPFAAGAYLIVINAVAVSECMVLRQNVEVVASFPKFAVGSRKDDGLLAIKKFYSDGFTPLGAVIDSECDDHIVYIFLKVGLGV